LTSVPPTLSHKTKRERMGHSAPRLSELKTLDFIVTTGRIAAQVETAGDKIYQRS